MIATGELPTKEFINHAERMETGVGDEMRSYTGHCIPAIFAVTRFTSLTVL